MEEGVGGETSESVGEEYAGAEDDDEEEDVNEEDVNDVDVPTTDAAAAADPRGEGASIIVGDFVESDVGA